MRIAVVTLPLHTNYGGVLQAYALKTVLADMGHQCDLIDRECKLAMPPSWKMPLIHMKRMFMNVIALGKGPEVFRERRIMKELPVVGKEILRFTDEYISPRIVRKYADIQMGEYDAFIAGSDQIWRPAYFGDIEDAFLKFTGKWNVKRVSYAASFGTDMLEYTYEQLEACGSLLKRFDAVSVREQGAVVLCDEWFDREDAVHVLDPVMLLDKEHYSRLASDSVLRPAKGKVLSYILDKSEEKSAVAALASKWLSAEIHDASVNPRDPNPPVKERIVPSMEQWLACFEDADFVVTDSFHGCVMSILFHKPFLVLGNACRGLSRVTSLLDMFGLEDRLVQGVDPEDDGEYYISGIDWNHVDAVLEEWRRRSIDFLKKSLR